MEIKHTIEILTKDIQDIENLVRNLKKTPTPSRIEIDLAMSKLRNVYELLSIISEDIRSDHELKRAAQSSPAGISDTGETGERMADMESGSVEESLAEKPRETKQDEVQSEELLPEETGRKEPKAEEKTPPAPHAGDEAGKTAAGTDTARNAAPANDAGPAPEKAPAESTEETVRKEPPADHSAKNNEEQGEKPVVEEKKVAAEEERKAQILAEKFAANKNINEKNAPGSDRDLSSRLIGEPIDSIKRNIGINDRFMIIRELLEGNNEKFNKIVSDLDNCASFDEANQKIEQEFSGKTDHEGVVLLARLARRRYMGR